MTASDQLEHACTHPQCRCSSFTNEESRQSRFCVGCRHSYLLHALRPGVSDPAEVLGLVLHGTAAIPVRTKVLLDRLIASASTGDVCSLLNRFGWTRTEFDQGYRLQVEPWSVLSRDEELVVIQQLGRFGCTAELAQHILLAEIKDRQESFARAIALQNLRPEANSAEVNTGTAPSFLRAQPTPPAPQQRLSEDGALNLSVRRTTEKTDSLKQEPSHPDASSSPLLALAQMQRELAQAQSLKQEPHTDTLYRDEGPPSPSRCTTDPSSYGYGGTITSPAGKKRVICNQCQKTFCDKGALKIHHSAVHLREMHKCSIEGCNMWFSSRRSRNRHSSNLNPKLHSPFRGNGQPIYNVDRPEKWKLDHCDKFKLSGAPYLENGDEDRPDDVDYTLGDSNQPDSSSASLCDVDEEMMEDGDLSRTCPPSTAESAASYEEDVALALYARDALRTTPQLSLVTSPNTAADEPPAKRRRKSLNPSRLPRYQVEDTPQAELEESHTTTAESPSNDRFSCLDEASPSASGSFQLASGLTIFDTSSMQLQSILPRRSAEPSPTPSSKLTTTTRTSPCSWVKGEKGLSPTVEIPLDPENNRLCLGCNKLFQNPFSMKLHYQNVHLKLMHPCTIEGCGNMFPSKRSRDRHSANVNLHYRLLVERGEITDNMQALMPNSGGFTNLPTQVPLRNQTTHSKLDNPPDSPSKAPSTDELSTYRSDLDIACQ